ncbi:pectin lyase-like protein [Mycena olivaceomarginata]|nr:pectin lyase-like protein [Mycena olivaceomarginata]
MPQHHSYFGLLLLAALWHPALALSPKFVPCQIQKPASTSPLSGCPAGTIFVSQNASDPHTQFTSIQAAIQSLPPTGAATILIAQGVYHETVNVTRSAPLTLLGQLPSTAVARAEPFANASSPNMNLVQVFQTNFVVPGEDDAASAVLTVAPNGAGGLIGAGPTGAPLQPVFGNTDFKAYNIDFQNRAATFAISQALATDISYANASFYGCSFASFQDTWYTGRNGSTYVVDSVIFGQTDYLFGFGTAWFQNVILANRACGGGLVAWKGTNQTDAPGNRYGAYISDSQIIRSPDANSSTSTTGLCFLGRPWNELATTVYLSTFMDASVRPAGWTTFSTPTQVPNRYIIIFFGLIGHLVAGPGGNTSQRVPIEHKLTATQVQSLDLTIDGVFLEHPNQMDRF